MLSSNYISNATASTVEYIKKEVYIPNMMTIDRAFQEFKKENPHTAISRTMIRNIILAQKIPVVKSGRKKVFDFNELCIYLSKCFSNQIDPNDNHKAYVYELSL